MSSNEDADRLLQVRKDILNGTASASKPDEKEPVMSFTPGLKVYPLYTKPKKKADRTAYMEELDATIIKIWRGESCTLEEVTRIVLTKEPDWVHKMYAKRQKRNSKKVRK